VCDKIREGRRLQYGSSGQRLCMRAMIIADNVPETA